MYVCKQTFGISKVRVSQKVESVIMRNLRYYFLYKDECIARFSYLHYCTFNNIAIRFSEMKNYFLAFF